MTITAVAAENAALVLQAVDEANWGCDVARKVAISIVGAEPYAKRSVGWGMHMLPSCGNARGVRCCASERCL